MSITLKRFQIAELRKSGVLYRKVIENLPQRTLRFLSGQVLGSLFELPPHPNKPYQPRTEKPDCTGNGKGIRHKLIINHER